MRKRELTRVSSKGQIVLPKRYRDRMGVKDGDYVSIYEVADGVLILEKMKPTALESLSATLRDEAERRDFSRDELESAIKAVRTGQTPNGD